MRRLLRATWLVLLGAMLGAGFVVAMEAGLVKVQHDGRCGLQQWVRPELLRGDIVLEGNYDEFDIQNRWVRAHGRVCEPIWIDGPLQADASEYWPPLHFAVAADRDWQRLKNEIDTATDAELTQRDPLGRTLMHWAVIHPQAETVKKALLQRGLGLDDRDSDGLSPRDWEARYVTSGG